MRIIKPSYQILQCPTYSEALRICETAGRICYLSEPKGDPEGFIRNIIKRGHHNVLEHCLCTFQFTTSRAVANELVRHRLCSFSQTSTRYVNYGNKEMEFIQPYWCKDIDIDEYNRRYADLPDGCGPENPTRTEDNKPMSNTYSFWEWKQAMTFTEQQYNRLIKQGLLPPQAARGVLPLDLRTDIIWSCNLRQLRYMFDLRALDKTGPAHPDIKALFVPLLEEMRQKLPVFFDDLITPILKL